jgi:hypothetical protein
MILVSEIWDETKKILGNCTDEVGYKKLNRAIEILANKSDWDPLTGFIDIVCTEQKVALPREIETPLMISYGPYPALPRDRLFQFHLNGPGGRSVSVDWRWWEDGPDAVTMRDLPGPSVLVATAEDARDVGREMWVYGFGDDGQPIRTEVDGVMTDGCLVTVQAGYVADPAAPVFARIARVRKPESTGPIKLWSVTGNALDVLLAVYAWDDTEPVFRRLLLDRFPAKPNDPPASQVVRIHFRKRNFAVRSQTDLIPLHSAEAIVMMLQALNSYKDREFDIAMASEATAVRWLTEEQATRNPPIATPMQVLDKPNHDDYLE